MLNPSFKKKEEKIKYNTCKIHEVCSFHETFSNVTVLVILIYKTYLSTYIIMAHFTEACIIRQNASCSTDFDWTCATSKQNCDKYCRLKYRVRFRIVIKLYFVCVLLSGVYIMSVCIALYVILDHKTS